MPWLELTDLPFAAALREHRGGLETGADYDCAHFDSCDFAGQNAERSRFLECAFTRVSFAGGGLRRARLTDVWLRDARLTGTTLAETNWTDATLLASALAGVEAFGARFRRVRFTGCKLDSVNFRDAEFTEVVFEDCLLRDADFTGATLSRTSFPGSRLTATTFSRMTLDDVDLRGAELGLITDVTSLRGATISTAQVAAMAALIADGIGLTVDDP